jgi:hypothetical protein
MRQAVVRAGLARGKGDRTMLRMSRGHGLGRVAVAGAALSALLPVGAFAAAGEAPPGLLTLKP